MDEKFQFQSDTYIQIILKYDNKMEFRKHGKHFFTQAKVSKVLNLDFQFFLYRLSWQIMKRISRQDQKCVLTEFMHYPKQDKHVIYSYHVVVQ